MILNKICTSTIYIKLLLSFSIAALAANRSIWNDYIKWMKYPDPELHVNEITGEIMVH